MPEALTISLNGCGHRIRTEQTDDQATFIGTILHQVLNDPTSPTHTPSFMSIIQSDGEMYMVGAPRLRAVDKSKWLPQLTNAINSYREYARTGKWPGKSQT